jgi:hypothetical protein
MRAPWGKFPPIMERTLRDDVMLTLCFLVGAELGALVFGADAAFSQGLAIGGLAMMVALNVLRFTVHPAGARGDD